MLHPHREQFPLLVLPGVAANKAATHLPIYFTQRLERLWAVQPGHTHINQDEIDAWLLLVDGHGRKARGGRACVKSLLPERHFHHRAHRRIVIHDQDNGLAWAGCRRCLADRRRLARGIVRSLWIGLYSAFHWQDRYHDGPFIPRRERVSRHG